MERNGILFIDYQLRYYLHIDPDSLTDAEWATAIEALKKIRKDEAKEFNAGKK
ncbi:MAG: hypothetical protein LBT04_02065 [Prevotellaceae bacterium]|nr:hypothetical protein [Prevotellaceae bacterium]